MQVALLYIIILCTLFWYQVESAMIWDVIHFGIRLGNMAKASLQREAKALEIINIANVYISYTKYLISA